MPAQSKEIKNIWMPQEIRALLWTPSRGKKGKKKKKRKPTHHHSFLQRENTDIHVYAQSFIYAHMLTNIYHVHIEVQSWKPLTAITKRRVSWQDCKVDHMPNDESNTTKLPFIYLNKSNCRIYHKPQITTSHGFQELLGRHWKCIPLMCCDHRMTESGWINYEMLKHKKKRKKDVQ